MKSKEANFSKLEKSNKTYHDEHINSSKSTTGKGNMNTKRYKYAVTSAVEAKLSKIKNDKESSDELSNKLFTLISTCIGTHVTATSPSVVTDISITRGKIDTSKLAAIDAANQL